MSSNDQAKVPKARLECSALPPSTSRFILPQPPSELLSRLQAFLPQIKQANEALMELDPADASMAEEPVSLEAFSSSEEETDSDDSSSSEEENDDEEEEELGAVENGVESTTAGQDYGASVVPEGRRSRSLTSSGEANEGKDSGTTSMDTTTPFARLLDITARPDTSTPPARSTTEASKDGKRNGVRIVEM
jgi:hypothetical protein